MKVACSTRPVGRADIIPVAVICALGVGLPLWMSVASGAVGVPGNDDWVYMRAAGGLFRSGTPDMVGHTAASIGQLVLSQPFLWLSGGAPWAFTAFGLVMGLIGLVATYLLARSYLNTGMAVLATVIIVVFPGFLRETGSFMTDVPCYALIMLSLLLGTRFLIVSRSLPSLAAGLAAGLIAFSIREFALAAPIAILICAWATSHVNERRWLLVLALLSGLGAIAILRAAMAVPGAGPPAPFDLKRITGVGASMLTFSAVLLPALVLATARWRHEIRPAHLILGAGIAALLVAAPVTPFIGNLWQSNGIAGDLLLAGNRSLLIGPGAWVVSWLISVLAGILVCALAMMWIDHQLRSVRTLESARAWVIRFAQGQQALLFLFVVGYISELVLYAPVGSIIDRYLYPIVPPAAILLLGGVRLDSAFARSHAGAHAALAWLALSAFVISANAFAYDAARFRAGEAAVGLGYDARTVDAGYEWVGSHGVGPISGKPNDGDFNWYDKFWSSFRPCAVLSNSELGSPSLALIQADMAAYRQYLAFGPDQPLYLYGARASGCPPPPGS